MQNFWLSFSTTKHSQTSDTGPVWKWRQGPMQEVNSTFWVTSVCYFYLCNLPVALSFSELHCLGMKQRGVSGTIRHRRDKANGTSKVNGWNYGTIWYNQHFCWMIRLLSDKFRVVYIKVMQVLNFQFYLKNGWNRNPMPCPFIKLISVMLLLHRECCHWITVCCQENAEANCLIFSKQTLLPLK